MGLVQKNRLQTWVVTQELVLDGNPFTDIRRGDQTFQSVTCRVAKQFYDGFVFLLVHFHLQYVLSPGVETPTVKLEA